MPLGPEARYEQIESISLAFVTALQILPPRQLAVLILRDVLGFRANEVADMLDSTVGSVTSGLNRARVSLQRRQPIAEHGAPPTPGSPAEDAIVAKFVRAYESGDVDALVTLLTDDAFSSMPPIPLEYHGRDAVARLCASIFRASPGFDLVPTRANGQPAFRGLPARPYRHPPRDRPAPAHPHRRPDLRHHPLRQRRAPLVRAAAIAPKPVGPIGTLDGGNSGRVGPLTRSYVGLAASIALTWDFTVWPGWLVST